MFKNKLMFIVKHCYIVSLPAVSHMNTFSEPCPGRGSWERLPRVQAIRDSLSGENLRAKVKPLVNLLFINTICPKSQRMSVIKYSSSPERLTPTVLRFLYYCFSFSRIGSFYIFSVFNEPWIFSFITNQYPSRASEVTLVVKKKNAPANAGDFKRWGFDPWVGKKRKWQSTPAFLPGKSHGQKSLTGYSMGSQSQTQLSDWTPHSILLYYKFCICPSCHHLLKQSHVFD